MTTTMQRSEETQVPMPLPPRRHGRAAVTIGALVVAASAAVGLVIAFDDSSTSDPVPAVEQTDKVPVDQDPLVTRFGVEDSEVPVDQDPLVTRFGK